MFIQLGVHMVDTVPACTGTIKVILHGWLSPSSLHIWIHPGVSVVMGQGSMGPRQTVIQS